MTAKPSRVDHPGLARTAPSPCAVARQKKSSALKAFLGARLAYSLALKVRGDAVFFPIAVAGRVGSPLASDLLGFRRDGGPFDLFAPALLGFGKGTLRLWRQTLRRGLAGVVFFLAHVTTCSAGWAGVCPQTVCPQTRL
jgi:hypothetical protein